MKQIKVAKELNGKKNQVAEVSLQQRQDLYIIFKAQKEKIKKLTNDSVIQKNKYDAKMQERKEIIEKIKDMENENIAVNEDIYQLEVEKLRMQKDKQAIDKENLSMKEDVELDNNTKYDRWCSFAKSKDLREIPDILVKICREKG